MKYNYITIGGATEDITFYTKAGVLISNADNVLHPKLLAFDYGQKIKIDKSHATFGGGASNTAVCMARLGLKVATIISIGDDYRGDGVVKNLKKNKVGVDLIQRHRDVETGFSFLLEAQGNEHIVFSNRAANAELKITNHEFRIINQAEWIYVASLPDKWRSILDEVFKSTAKIAWNPGYIQIEAGYRALKKYLSRTRVLSLNQEEAVELVYSSRQHGKVDKEYFGDVNNLLKEISDWGVEIVLITRGRHGADVYDGKRYYHQPIIKGKKTVNTTGAGDAFGSTFVVGLKMFNGDIQKSMKLAARNTSSIVSHHGAQTGLLTKYEILK